MCVKLLSGFFWNLHQRFTFFSVVCVWERERSEVLNRAAVSNFL